MLAPRSSGVSGIQRSRLLAGAAAAIGELGYQRATVGRITTRAGVSRRTFYELFADRDECFAALLDDVVARVRGELTAADLDGVVWRERVRLGLWTILAFLDREPALARVCVVYAAQGGPRVLARREEVMARLIAVVDEGRLQGARGGMCTPVTAEGLVGAALAIVHARVGRGEREPLTGLLGELMGLIVLPYLGRAAARREQARAIPAAPPTAAVTTAARVSAGPRSEENPLCALPIRITYRTARVLEAIAELSGGEAESPSNREVALRAGIADAGQVSKLLRRLERLGLLENGGGGHAHGEPNAWRLTQQGEWVAHSIAIHDRQQRRAA